MANCRTFNLPRRSAVALALVALAITVLTAGGFVSPVRGESESNPPQTGIWFSTDIEVSPDGEAEGLWRCLVVVTDLASGEVLVAPSIVFPAGDPAEVQSRLGDGTEFQFEVRVEEGGSGAAWSSEIRRESQVLNTQKGTVRLSSRGNGQQGG